MAKQKLITLLECTCWYVPLLDARYLVGFAVLWVLYEPHHEKTCLRGLQLNRPAQLQKQARVLKFRTIASTGIIPSRKRITMVLIRLCTCAVWSAPLFFAYGINRFSHDMAYIIPIIQMAKQYLHLGVVFSSAVYSQPDCCCWCCCCCYRYCFHRHGNCHVSPE